MNRKELYEKCQLLKAGQIVEIDGDWFKAFRLEKSFGGKACEACELDSICKGDVAIVCDELDWPSYDRWYLKLAHR